MREIELYRGFTIILNESRFFYVEEYPASAFVSAEVAKRCLDVLIRRLGDLEQDRKDMKRAFLNNKVK